MIECTPRIALAPALLLCVALAACDSSLKDEPFGDLEITTTAPTAEQPFTTADGWSIDYEKLLVHVTAINVAGADEVLTAYEEALVVDQAAAPPKLLLAAAARKPRLWEDVNFQIGPAAPADEMEVVLVGTATEADAALLQTGGYAIYVEGVATRAAERKTFKWGFSTDTIYSACEGGIEALPDQTATAEIVMRGDVLFADDLADGAALRFDPFAAADGDGDGEITLEEIAAVTLEDVRTATGAPYASEAEGLATFLDAQTRRIVATYRGQGRCTASNAEEGDE